MTGKEQELKWVPLGINALFDEEPFPPREPGDITDLTSAIRIHGILSPLLLRMRNGRYQVICGYQRYLAAKAAGLSKLPALVADLDDAEAIRSYLSENIIRRPIGARSQEEALNRLKRLRDGSFRSEAGPEVMENPPLKGTDRLAPWMESEEATGSRKRVLELSSPQAPAPGETMGQTLERMESFLSEIRSHRLVQVAEAELLTDRVLELKAADAPPDLGVPLTARRGDFRDFTAPHSLLVALLCARVASFLEWSEDKTRVLVTGGLLHDIGMVFLWGPVGLGKPHALSRADKVALRSHTRIGCALIAGTRAWPEVVSFCARDHHERWDGSGYPGGRLAEEVSCEARLVGIADAYIASISHRPHRRALPPATALERISESFRRGCFDPALFPALRGALQSERVEGGPILRAFEAAGMKPAESTAS